MFLLGSSSTGSEAAHSCVLCSSENTVSFIVSFLLQLISLVENNSVVVIRGTTGSGKTTQLPQYILDYYSEKNTPCNIVVTQPRKIGASSIARWVARERKCILGSVVGYQVGVTKKLIGLDSFFFLYLQ